MVIAVVSGKGGTGKSTITLNLAGVLSTGNQRVFVVDADPQGSIARWAKISKQKEPTILVKPSPVIDKNVKNIIKDRITRVKYYLKRQRGQNLMHGCLFPV